MKISFLVPHSYDLNDSQVSLIQRLGKVGATYLHEEDEDVAESCPGVIDVNGECKYALNDIGMAILMEINNQIDELKRELKGI